MKKKQSMFTPPSLTNPTPVESSETMGGDLGRPTLFRPGQKTQIDATGMPTKPGFKFPSQMWTE